MRLRGLGKGSEDTPTPCHKGTVADYAQVKDRCIAKPESYEERKARREAGRPQPKEQQQQPGKKEEEEEEEEGGGGGG